MLACLFKLTIDLAYKMIKAPFITATGDAEFGI
jgi:hypothetical protein